MVYSVHYFREERESHKDLIPELKAPDDWNINLNDEPATNGDSGATYGATCNNLSSKDGSRLIDDLKEAKDGGKEIA